jgi:lysozyme family protein
MEKNRETSFAHLQREAPGVVADLFWSAMRCDELPSGVDYYMMDTAAAYGVLQASRWLNLILNLPNDDLVTNLTISAAAKVPVHVVIAGLELHRRRRARADPRWQINHSILTNRCNRARHRAVMMYDEVTA